MSGVYVFSKYICILTDVVELSLLTKASFVVLFRTVHFMITNIAYKWQVYLCDLKWMYTAVGASQLGWGEESYQKPPIKTQQMSSELHWKPEFLSLNWRHFTVSQIFK